MGGVVKDNITNLQADPDHVSQYLITTEGGPISDRHMELGPLPAERPDRGLWKPLKTSPEYLSSSQTSKTLHKLNQHVG